MSRLRTSKYVLAVVTVIATLWAVPSAYADDGCPWRVVPAGGSLWHQGPWWPYLVGGLCVLAGLVLVFLFWRQRRNVEDDADRGPTAE